MTRPGDRYRVGVDIGGTFTDFVLAWRSWIPLRPVVIHSAIAPPDPGRCPPASSGAGG